MAIPSFVGAGSGNGVTTGALTISKTGVTVGNFIIVHALNKDSGSLIIDSATGVANLAGTASSLTSGGGAFDMGSPTSGGQNFWLGRATDTTVSVQISNGAGTEDMIGRIFEFSGVSDGTTLADVIENNGGASNLLRQSLNTSTSILPNNLDTTGTDQLGLVFVGLNSDQALDSFTGESGGDWTEVTAEYQSSTPAAAIGLQSAAMAAAGTISNGSDTITSAAWSCVVTSLLPLSGQTLLPDADTAAGGWAAVGAASLYAATSDASDSTYMLGTAS